MRHLRFHEYGNPAEVLYVEETASPVIDNQSALVKIIAAGINASDAKNIMGQMQGSSVPRIPSRDFSGVVEVGPAEWRGKKVWGSGGDVGFTVDGSHSQYLSLPVNALVNKPDSLSDDEAATSALSFVTAYLCFEAGTRPGFTKTAVIIGASGGVGDTAMQICHHFGIRAIGLVRSKDSCEKLLVLGFEAFTSEALDASADLKKLDVDRVDLIIDTVGGKMVNVAFSILSKKGCLAEISCPSINRFHHLLTAWAESETLVTER